MCALLIWNTKKITITNAFQKILDESNRKPNKKGVETVKNFTIDQWNHGCKTCTQHIMKGNLLLLKNLLES